MPLWIKRNLLLYCNLEVFIGKYLSSLRKLDYVLVRKEGLKTQL